jgi:hypothetical protein
MEQLHPVRDSPQNHASSWILGTGVSWIYFLFDVSARTRFRRDFGLSTHLGTDEPTEATHRVRSNSFIIFILVRNRATRAIVKDPRS